MPAEDLIAPRTVGTAEKISVTAAKTDGKPTDLMRDGRVAKGMRIGRAAREGGSAFYSEVCVKDYVFISKGDF